MKYLSIAFSFLTIFPAIGSERWEEQDFGKAAVFFPLTGLAIGGFCGLFRGFFGGDIGAALTLILWIILSGGLHLDGLADCMDGFCYSGTQERRREIMKDSRLGTYGALGLFCALLLKFLLIRRARPALLPFDFMLIAAAARWAVLILLRFPLANPNGMAAALRIGYQRRASLPALFFVLIPLIWLPLSRLMLIPAAAICACAVGLLARKKIGGITGDTLGFAIEVTEIILLCLI